MSIIDSLKRENIEILEYISEIMEAISNADKILSKEEWKSIIEIIDKLDNSLKTVPITIENIRANNLEMLEYVERLKSILHACIN